jgi:ATP-dependent Clp protease ATP-binding subunit ClpA
VNRYKIGEQEDYWGSLSIEKLSGGFQWFTETEGVMGQGEAVQRVLDVLAIARAGLSGGPTGTATKPKGILFFAGATGVGKTFLAKKLAKFLFGSEDAFIRFDMSEYKEEHTVARLIGSPPGYVGHERGGMLTNAVRDKPFAVILFDEIEKAHPKVMDVFLQILDEGRLTDSRGQTVFFTETVVVFTSNIGARSNDTRGHDIAEWAQLEALLRSSELSETDRRLKIRDHFASAVRRFFMYEISRPELLNRIGNNIVTFNYINTTEVQYQIVESHLRRLATEFQERYRILGYTLNYTAEVVRLIVEAHAEEINLFGGRAVANVIMNDVVVPVAKAALRAEFKGLKKEEFLIQVDPQTKLIVCRYRQ